MPAFINLLSIPMVLERVPPNPLYGFRTLKTLSSPDIGYPANRVSGWLMSVASLMAIAFSLALWSIYDTGPTAD